MKLRTVRIIICLSVIYLITGCSTKKYSFTIDAPAKYSSEYAFKRMEIQPFKTNRKQYGNTIATLLNSGVAKEGYIRVVQDGAECILAGVLDIGNFYKKTKTERYKCTKYRNEKKYESTCYTYYYTKKVMIKVDYTLSGSADGNVIWGDSICYDFNKTWSSYESSSEARDRALTDDQIINGAVKGIALKIVQSVTPHKETVSRELQEGSDDNIKLGIKYLENGRTEQAISIWDQCINRSETPEDKAAAYYNIGVVKESQGFYRDAFELYSRADSLLPAEDLYIQSMTRVENLKKNGEKLRSWEN